VHGPRQALVTPGMIAVASRARFVALVTLVCSALWVSPAVAQQAGGFQTLSFVQDAVVARVTDVESIAAAPPQPAAATVDVADLWRWLLRRPPPKPQDPASAARKRTFVVAPIIGSKPSTGLSLGVAGNMTFFRGDPQTTHISTASGGIRLTEKHQLLSGMRLSVFTDQDRWFLQGDNRFQLTSLGTYDLGTDTPATGVNAKFHYSKWFDALFRRVTKRLFVGGGLDADSHSSIAPGTGTTDASWAQSALVAYSAAHQFSATSQTSGGTSLNVLFDSRDSSVNPQHGWLASASYRTFFKGFLGGDATWQELYLDTRTYVRLTRSGRHTLAFWGIGDLVTGGTPPFLDLPEIGSDGRSGRGYGEGRFRGDQLAYGEVEYRGTLSPNGLFGMVLFVNTTTVGDRASHEQLGDSFAFGRGLGLRVLLNKRSKTNLCADYGWGQQGSRGFYLTIQEAF